MSNELVVINKTEYEFAYFTDETGKRWYDLSRIAKSLGITDFRRLADRIADKHKKLINVKMLHMQVKSQQSDKEYPEFYAGYSGQRGNPNKWFVDDPGMYQAIIGSNSPKADTFTEWVTAEVIPSIISTGTYSLPNKQALPQTSFYIRYAMNQPRVAFGYFSVINELLVTLNAKFEVAGHMIPDKGPDGREIRPDVSVGRRFSDYLKNNHPEHADKYKLYTHAFQDGTEVEARMYEDSLLPIFRRYVESVWMKECAYQYFMERDVKAIDYLPKIIPDFRLPQKAIA